MSWIDMTSSSIRHSFCGSPQWDNRFTLTCDSPQGKNRSICHSPQGDNRVYPKYKKRNLHVVARPLLVQISPAPSCMLYIEDCADVYAKARPIFSLRETCGKTAPGRTGQETALWLRFFTAVFPALFSVFIFSSVGFRLHAEFLPVGYAYM